MMTVNGEYTIATNKNKSRQSTESQRERDPTHAEAQVVNENIT